MAGANCWQSRQGPARVSLGAAVVVVLAAKPEFVDEPPGRLSSALLQGRERRELRPGLCLSSAGGHVLAADAHAGRHGVAALVRLGSRGPHRRAELTALVELLVPGELSLLLDLGQVAHDVGMMRSTGVDVDPCQLPANSCQPPRL